jgi:hypothetical protein
MTTPRVVELPRRLEPISRDTFLATGEIDVPLAVVVTLRPRDARGMRRPTMVRRGARPPLRAVPDLSPGDPAA